jgi:serine/threonine protein kinase
MDAVPRPLDTGELAGAETVSARIPIGARATESGSLLDRYHDEGELGRGGMGEVRLCLDHRIGRRVALKLLRPGQGSGSVSRARFLREARVQGRLEHPAIVPVYDLGVAGDERPFFTMKRIGGHTLAQVLEAIAAGDTAMADRWTRRRLLNAFAQVSQAVQYAHEQGVIHRDLKPSNIMLGDFGEVYVLDWGVAKLVDEVEDDRSTVAQPRASVAADDEAALTADTALAATEGRDLLGTPGYMAPEQIDGVSARVGIASDVYALGAILFEILALQPLHARHNLAAVLGSTIAGVDLAERLRACGDAVPPELAAICERATRLEADERYADVRALLLPLERFLEGDRDLELRRGLARVATDEAESAAKVALELGDAEARSRALAACSRALALDPEDVRARGTLVELLFSPPERAPESVERELVESERETVRTNARGGVSAFASYLAFVPVVAWMGLRDPVALGALVGLIAIGIGISILGARAARPEVWAAPASLAVSTLSLMVLSRVFGPFVLVPGMAMANAIGFSLESRGPRRIAYVAVSAFAIAVPAALELAGVLPASYGFVGGTLAILPRMTELPELQSMVLLWTASLAAVVVPAMLVSRTRDALREAERRLAVLAWQLRQLVPQQARGERS